MVQCTIHEHRGSGVHRTPTSTRPPQGARHSRQQQQQRRRDSCVACTEEPGTPQSKVSWGGWGTLEPRCIRNGHLTAVRAQIGDSQSLVECITDGVHDRQHVTERGMDPQASRAYFFLLRDRALCTSGITTSHRGHSVRGGHRGLSDGPCNTRGTQGSGRWGLGGSRHSG